jgi:hypothetical protein
MAFTNIRKLVTSKCTIASTADLSGSAVHVGYAVIRRRVSRFGAGKSERFNVVRGFVMGRLISGTASVLSGSARTLAMCAFVAAAACTDSTAPDSDPVVTPPIEKDAPNPALTALGAWLPSATTWVIDNMEDQALQSKVRGLLSDLAQQLTASNAKGAQAGVASVRAALTGVSADQVIELGPIDVAMSTVEDALAAVK